MKEDNKEFEEEDLSDDNDRIEIKNDFSDNLPKNIDIIWEKLNKEWGDQKKLLEQIEQHKKDLERQEISDEKQHLIDIFEDLKDNIEDKSEESLVEIYKDILEAQETKNKTVKKQMNNFLLCIML